MGIILLIIGIRNTIRLANTELLYEMSCTNEDGAFFLRKNMGYIAIKKTAFRRPKI